MSLLHFLPILLATMLSLTGQQSGLPVKPERFMIMEIGSAIPDKKFEFTLVWLMRSGKTCELRRQVCKSPYRLSVYDESYLIIYGKSGEGIRLAES